MERIYGVSYKLGNEHPEAVYYRFDNEEDAIEWLHTEEYDFRTRDLFYTKEEVIDFLEDEARDYFYDVWQESFDTETTSFEEELRGLAEWYFEESEDEFKTFKRTEQDPEADEYMFGWA